MLWNIAVNDAGADYDPLTLLRSRTMFGRPDWNSIYTRMREAIETGQYIPGSNSQLKTKVGVSSLLYIPRCVLLTAIIDLLLWTQRSRQSYQRSYRSAL